MMGVWDTWYDLHRLSGSQRSWIVSHARRERRRGRERATACNRCRLWELDGGSYEDLEASRCAAMCREGAHQMRQ
jgi:ferredoxin